jgi:hypothetical protein
VTEELHCCLFVVFLQILGFMTHVFSVTISNKNNKIQITAASKAAKKKREKVIIIIIIIITPAHQTSFIHVHLTVRRALRSRGRWIRIFGIASSRARDFIGCADLVESKDFG